MYSGVPTSAPARVTNALSAPAALLERRHRRDGPRGRVAGRPSQHRDSEVADLQNRRAASLGELEADLFDGLRSR